MAAVRISLKFRRYPDADLQVFADRVIGKMTDNDQFPDPVVPLSQLTNANADFKQAIAAAQFKASAAIKAKAQRRSELLDLLKHQAAYVQFAAHVNANAALSSGFDLASNNTTPQPLKVPVILAIRNVASTKLGLKIRRVRNARVYEVWLRELKGEWRLAQTFPNTRNMVLTGLTPGTLYQIRARAVGGSTGYSQWSTLLQHMST